MAISKKHRRNILCDGKKYIWYVHPDEEQENRLALNIMSDDKQYILYYPIEENPMNYIFSQGHKFQGKTVSGCRKCSLYPQEIPDIIHKYYDDKGIRRRIPDE